MSRLTRLLILTCFVAVACQEDVIRHEGLQGPLEGIAVDALRYPHAGLKDVRVTIEGTNPEVSTLTDTNGKFYFENLETGTYDLVFSKQGYGTQKRLGYSFVGGDESPYIVGDLYQLSNIAIEDYELEAVKTQVNVLLDVTITAWYVPEDEKDQLNYVRYYLSNKPDVSPTNYMESVSLSFGTSFGLPIDTEKFAPGSDLYFVMYPCRDQAAGYLNLENGNMIYSSVSPNGSEVKSIKVPQ